MRLHKIKLKKGIGGIQFFLTLLFFFLAIFVFFVVRVGSKDAPIAFVGQNALLLLAASEKGADALSYLYKSAEFSLDQSIYDLAKNGGLRQGDCGRYSGVSVWADIEKTENGFVVRDCYPDNKKLQDNLIANFDEEIKNYVVLYPDAYIPLNYEYRVAEEGDTLKIVGLSDDKIEIMLGEIIDFSEGDIDIPNIPGQLRGSGIPVKSRVDIKSIQESNPEVLVRYQQLCKEKGYEASGECTPERKKCCITSAYRKGRGYHGLGYALDIYVGDVTEQIEWAKAADKIGFTGIFVYPCGNDPHLHVDLRPKNHCRAWGKCFENGKMIANARGSKTLSCKGDSVKVLEQCGGTCSG